jgi:hypothetical protein
MHEVCSLTVTHAPTLSAEGCIVVLDQMARLGGSVPTNAIMAVVRRLHQLGSITTVPPPLAFHTMCVLGCLPLTRDAGGKIAREVVRDALTTAAPFLESLFGGEEEDLHAAIAPAAVFGALHAAALFAHDFSSTSTIVELFIRRVVAAGAATPAEATAAIADLVDCHAPEETLKAGAELIGHALKTCELASERGFAREAAKAVKALSAALAAAPRPPESTVVAATLDVFRSVDAPLAATVRDTPYPTAVMLAACVVSGLPSLGKVHHDYSPAAVAARRRRVGAMPRLANALCRRLLRIIRRATADQPSQAEVAQRSAALDLLFALTHSISADASVNDTQTLLDEMAARAAPLQLSGATATTPVETAPSVPPEPVPTTSPVPVSPKQAALEAEVFPLYMAKLATLSPRSVADGLRCAPSRRLQLLSPTDKQAIVNATLRASTALPPLLLADVVHRLGAELADVVDDVTAGQLASLFQQAKYVFKLGPTEAARCLAGLAAFHHQDPLAMRSLALQVAASASEAPLADIPVLADSLANARQFSPKCFAALCTSTLRQVGTSRDGSQAVQPLFEAFAALSRSYVLRRYRGSPFNDLRTLVRSRVIDEAHTFDVPTVLAAYEAFGPLDVTDTATGVALATRLAELHREQQARALLDAADPTDRAAALRQYLGAGALSPSASLHALVSLTSLAVDARNAAAMELVPPLLFSCSAASLELHPPEIIALLIATVQLSSPSPHTGESADGGPVPDDHITQHARLIGNAYETARAAFLHTFGTGSAGAPSPLHPAAATVVASTSPAAFEALLSAYAAADVCDREVIEAALAFADRHATQMMPPAVLARYLCAAASLLGRMASSAVDVQGTDSATAALVPQRVPSLFHTLRLPLVLYAGTAPRLPTSDIARTLNAVADAAAMSEAGGAASPAVQTLMRKMATVLVKRFPPVGRPSPQPRQASPHVRPVVGQAPAPETPGMTAEDLFD